jgi:hypothetical protein
MIGSSGRGYIPLYSCKGYILASLISSTTKEGRRLKDEKRRRKENGKCEVGSVK